MRISSSWVIILCILYSAVYRREHFCTCITYAAVDVGQLIVFVECGFSTETLLEIFDSLVEVLLLHEHFREVSVDQLGLLLVAFVDIEGLLVGVDSFSYKQ